MDVLRNMSLKWKLVLGFSTPLVLMLVIAITVYSSLDKLLETSKWVNHTHKAIGIGNDISGSLVNMETGLRGYLVAGKEGFLEPYVKGKKDFESLKNTAVRLVQDNPTQVARLEKVAKLQSRWVSEHVDVAMAYRREVNAGSSAAAEFRKISARSVGKEKFDGFRAALAELNKLFVKSNDLKAQALVQLILMDMINQETGQRGYLLSGVETSLDPYHAGKISFDEHVSSLKNLMSNAYDRADVTENIQSLKEIAKNWDEKVAKIGIALKKRSTEGAIPNSKVIEFVLKGKGKQYFDNSRVNIDVLTAAFKQSNDLLALGLVTSMAKNMVDMETGYRGFLLTGDTASLQPYEQGRQHFSTMLDSLHGLVERAYRVTDANKHLDTTIALAKDWNKLAAAPEIEARHAMNDVTRTSADISAFIEQGIGKKFMDEMRGTLDEFVDAESKLIAIRNTEQKSTADTATEVTIIGTVISLLISGVLTIFLTRNITSAIKQAVDVADKIAADDLNSVINSPSKDEIGKLLCSLSTMQSNLKQRIEAERHFSAENNRVKQALDTVSGNVMIVNNEMSIIYTNNAIISMMGIIASDLRKELTQLNTDNLVGQNIGVLFRNPEQQRTILTGLTCSNTSDVVIGGRSLRITANPVNDQYGDRLGTVLEWLDRTDEVAIEGEIQMVVNSSLAGELGGRIALDGKTGFFKMLSQGINNLVEISQQVIDDTIIVLGAISNGDLTKNIETDYKGSFEQLKNNTNATIAKLTEVMSEITDSADVVMNGSIEIAKGNDNLSQRTVEQASTLEGASSSMEEITSTVGQNADNAQKASKLAVSARDQADQGREIVTNAIAAMDEITDSSKRIADIISVIDEIAFQTNLLALNAAVEAARAGEQGRGFAVVASEVGTLAGRSATAAKEIKQLIEDSVAKVQEGSRLVDESGQTLEGITSSVTEVSEIITGIATASEEQSTGINQVNSMIVKIDSMTQKNAALVEEATASSQIMGGQTERLNTLVAFFNSSNATTYDESILRKIA